MKIGKELMALAAWLHVHRWVRPAADPYSIEFSLTSDLKGIAARVF
jgi:hypothetical protein